MPITKGTTMGQFLLSYHVKELYCFTKPKNLSSNHGLKKKKLAKKQKSSSKTIRQKSLNGDNKDKKKCLEYLLQVAIEIQNTPCKMTIEYILLVPLSGPPRDITKTSQLKFPSRHVIINEHQGELYKYQVVSQSREVH